VVQAEGSRALAWQLTSVAAMRDGLPGTNFLYFVGSELSRNDNASFGVNRIPSRGAQQPAASAVRLGGGKSLANPDGRGQSDGHIPDQAT